MAKPSFLERVPSNSLAWREPQARCPKAMPARRFSTIDGGRKDASQDDRTFRSPAHARTVFSHPLVEIYPPDFVRRRAIVRPGMTAETVQAASRAKLEYRFRAPMHLLVMYEDGARRGGETCVEGLPRATLRRFARKLTFVPAGCHYRELHELRTLSRLTYFYFDPAKFGWHGDTNIADLSFAPRLFFEDERLWQTALALAHLIEHPASGDQRYFEALGVVIMYQLMRPYRGECGGGRRQVRGGLAAWQQRIATAYIEDHLAERIELATLAQLVRQSPFHFCRAFKQSFGMPPLRYQTKRRIDHAKLLLAKPATSVTDIALTIGFGCSSSFATAFRKATGFTPTAYQRSLG